MLARNLFVILMLAACGFSTAPAWVDKGVNITYTVGNDQINYYVTDKNATDIFILKTNMTSSNNYHLDENPDQTTDNLFWFDSSMLQGAYNGEPIDDYTATGTASQQFQGKTLNTVTLTRDYGGGVTGTFVYDQPTGLLLSVTVSGAVAKPINIVSAVIPGVAAFAPAAPPAPTPPPQQNQTAPPPSGNVTPPTNNTQNATQPPQTPPPQGNPNPPPSQPPANTPPATTQQPSKKPITELCCPSAFILLLLGLLAMKRS